MISNPMQLLQALNPEPSCTAPPVSQLIDRLQADGAVTPHDRVDVVELSSQPSNAEQTEPRGSRDWASKLLSAASVGLALAVLVGALVVLHPRSRTAGGPPAARQTVPSPWSGSLLSQFAILRRPQTARDKQLPLVVKSMLGELPQRHDLLPTLTHVVGELPSRGQGRVLVLIIAHGPSPAHPRNIWLLTATPSPDGAGGVAGSPYTPGQLFPQIGQGYASELVPDAVKRVKWVFPERTVYPTIHDNVATAPVSVPRGRGPGLKSVTWYGAGGRVLASENQAMLDKRQAASEKPATTRNRAIAGQKPE